MKDAERLWPLPSPLTGERWDSSNAARRPAGKVGAGGTAAGHEQPTTDAGIATREREGDNRWRCTECGNLGERGICMAAQRGQIVASRSYTPIRDLLRRCEGFAPLPTDPDQTPGRIKWAWLLDIAKPKDATL